MTSPRLLLLLLGLASLPAREIHAQPVTTPLTVSASQRADALIGLARVAAARGDWHEAHARMTESARVRAFSPALLTEHFWIAVHVDREAAIALVTTLASQGPPTHDVFARWMALVTASEDLDGAVTGGLDVAHRATTAYPQDALWHIERAALALRAERAGRPDLAVRAWASMPDATRLAQAEWQASFLRTSAMQSSRAAMAPALDRFVADHPADAAMRQLAVEAWADAGQPSRALQLMTPLLGADAALATLRRAAALAGSSSDAALARSYLTRARTHAAASDADTWALADVLATANDGAALRRLIEMHPPHLDACRTRWVAVAQASGDETLLSEAALGISSGCPSYAPLAARVGAALVASGRTAEAEHWLAPLHERGQLDDDSRLVLARAFEARAAWEAIGEVLAPLVERAQQTAATPEAARRLAWAWQAQGRATDAWALARRLGALDDDSREAQAGWAALALSSGDVASADALSRRALDSARDTDARVVQAGIAARGGDAAGVRRWLAPVAASLDGAGAVLLWLDAVDALDGPNAALAALRTRATLIAASPELRARRALWAARVGDAARAHEDLATVRMLDADLGARLAIRLALVDGDSASAWQLIDATAPADSRGEAGDDWRRLGLDSALASEHWAEADRLLDERGDWLATRQRVLALARLHRGRDGALTSVDRDGLRAEVDGLTIRRDAAEILAADALDRRAPAEALTLLGVDPTDTAVAQLPTSTRALLADALLALGRAADVLRVTGTDETRPAVLQLRRAQALTALGRGDDARTLLATAARSSARAELFAAWADATPDPSARLQVLEEGLTLHASDDSLRLAHADAMRLTGDYDRAAREAAGLVAERTTWREAWQQLVASHAAAGAPATTATLERACAALGDTPDTRLLLIDALARAPRLQSDVVDVVLPWLGDVPPADVDRAARLQASLAITAGRWPVALDALAGLRQRHPGDRAVARLEAEATAWSGAHAAAVPLFEAYLAIVPDDVEAWRQFARLLTWRARATQAAAAYARAEALTSAPEVSAEARTRLAVLRRDWPAAVAAARDWRTVEPRRLDALTDLALALEQSGEAAQATQAYDQLARWPALPDTVQRTVAAYRWRQSTYGTMGVEVDHAEGFGGQRLLGRRETALGASIRLRQSSAAELVARIGDGRLDGGTLDTPYTQGQVALRAWPGRGIMAEAHLGATSVLGTSTMLGGLRVDARPLARLGVELSTARRPFWENAATVDSGLQAWSTAARVRLLGQGSVEASAGAEVATVSDGNRRGQVDAAVSRQFGAGPRQLEVRASAFLFGFRRASAVYFSPDAFGRLDLEVGVLRWLGRGAVVRDGRFALRARTGAGLDTTGQPALLTSGGLVVPLGARVGLAADGRLTSSRQFRAWGATVRLQVGLRDVH